MSDEWPGTLVGSSNEWPGTLVSEAKKESQADVLPDVAKSAGIGVVKGGIGLAGMPGDMRELGSKGISKAAGALGYDLPQETVSGALKHVPLPGLGGPTSAQLRETLENNVTGPLYEPKTTAGKYAQTAGEFLPAVIGGPETMATKLATRVAAPAIASEAAEQLTEGTGIEPYARIAGGVGAGLLAAPRRAGFTAPSIDRLEQAARENYRHPDVTSLGIDPSSLTRLAQTTWADLYRSGFRQNGVQRTYGTLEELVNPVSATGQPVSIARVADVDGVRRALNKIAGNFNNPEEQDAARRAIRNLDAYLGGNIPAVDVVQGNVTRANELLSDARQNWSAARHGQTLIDKLDQADLRAASTYSGGNLDNAIRQNVRRILDSPKLRRGYTNEQLDQMERIVRGTAIGNTARRIGKIGGGGGGLGTLAAAAVGEHAIGPAGYALPLVGNAARRMGEASTMRQAERLNQDIRANSPEGRAWLAIQNRTRQPALPASAAALARSPFYTEPLALPSGQEGRATGGKVGKSSSSQKGGSNPEQTGQIGVWRKFPIHVGEENRRENDGLKQSPSHGDSLHTKGGTVKAFHPVHIGAKRARDGRWYVPDPDRDGKYLRVNYGRT